MTFFKLLCDILKSIVIYRVKDIDKDKSYRYGIEKSPPTPPTPPFLLTIGNLLFVGVGLDRPASYEINIGFSTPGRP